MEKHDINRLETQIKELRGSLAHCAATWQHLPMTRTYSIFL